MVQKKRYFGTMNNVNIPYGYKIENHKLVIDEYQAKVIKLICDLKVYGLDERLEIVPLLNEFQVPKKYERDINFEELKNQIIKKAEEGRKEDAGWMDMKGV